MQTAVERVITNMWERYDEPLSLEEMADMAVFSRFYFSRVFRSITGTSPGRFLTAIRLYKAKNLLLETTMSVTDISYQVGYNSPGTFSSRFTRSVGISPARYRFLSESGITAPTSVAAAGPKWGTVRGSVTAPPSGTGHRVYVMLLDSTIPQGTPVACAALDSENTFEFTAVPEGQWFVHATAVAISDIEPRPWLRKPLFVAAARPVKVSGGRSVTANLELHPPRITDLPILLALPELDSRLPPAPAVIRPPATAGWQRSTSPDPLGRSVTATPRNPQLVN